MQTCTSQVTSEVLRLRLGGNSPEMMSTLSNGTHPRGQSGWAQAGPKWGPRWAQAKILGPNKIQKTKILKIKIRSAQNVGNIFLSRKKTFPAPFGALWAQFLRGPEKSKKYKNFAYFPWWANGPYSPGLGPMFWGMDPRVLWPLRSLFC